MGDTVNYGIIGCGMMGQEHLRNIKLLPATRIGAIFEPDAGMRKKAAAIAPEACFTDSLDALLVLPGIDCLVIASPNLAHVQQLERIADHPHRPVLVEKPLFTRAGDVDRVRQFMNGYGAPVWVAMEYRYMPPIARFIERQSVATGGLKMLTIREHRYPFLHKVGAWNRFNCHSGGTLVEKCCHFFDLMRLTTEGEPVRVMASAGQAVNHLDERYADGTPDIWDNAYVIVDFDNGVRAMLELCMFAEGSRYQEEISAVGPGGKIEVLVPGPGRFWPAHLGAPPVAKLIESPRVNPGPKVAKIPVDPVLLAAGDHNGSTFYQHEKFNALVRNGTTPEVTLRDGMRAVLIGLAAQEFAATGQAVALDFDADCDDRRQSA